MADFAPAHPGEVLREDGRVIVEAAEERREFPRYSENVRGVANFRAVAEGEELESNILQVGHRNLAPWSVRRSRSPRGS